MMATSMGLVWIVVKDFKKAIQFYTEVVGLKLMEINEQWHWAELQGEDGARLGIGTYHENTPIHPGENAIMTFTVKDVEKATADMTRKGAACVGKVQEVPGHVRMQLIKDLDGNHFQLVQLL